MLVRSTKFLTHDANNGPFLFHLNHTTYDTYIRHTELQKDDIVLIRQAPPLSKRKTHILHRILRSPESEALAARAGLLSQSQKEHAEKERIAREREGQGKEDVRIASEVMELARRAVVERDVKRRELGLEVN
jgi:hypothetical protein